jgi:hypothetical protein
MKKIFTLLCAVGLLTVAANAQTGSRDNRDKPQYDQRSTPQNSQRDMPQYDQRNDQQNGQWDKTNGYSNDDRYNQNRSYGRSIEMQVAQINRKYDIQAQRVRNDVFIRRFEKTRVLRSLEAQRQQEIRMVYARSGNNRGWKDDRGYNSNHY